jgi:hypothetical protein
MRKDDLRIIITTAIGIWILLIFLGVSNAHAKSVNCNKHPIYCQIKKNSPRIDKKKAMHLSNVIHKISRKYSLPTRIFVGILAQESGYKLEAKGCHKGLVKEVTHMETRAPMTTHPIVEYKEVKVCADFGIGQIYYKTAKGFGFNLNKLTTDLDYSVEAAAQVLADFKKRYSAREVDWWTRYNARSRIKRKIYKQLVERYF